MQRISRYLEFYSIVSDKISKHDAFDKRNFKFIELFFEAFTIPFRELLIAHILETFWKKKYLGSINIGCCLQGVEHCDSNF